MRILMLSNRPAFTNHMLQILAERTAGRGCRASEPQHRTGRTDPEALKTEN